MRNFQLAGSSVLAIGCCLASTAPAQNATAPSVVGLEEVIVTATKREQDLQTVPVAVTAISDELLQSRLAVNARDLIYLAPSLQRSASNGDANEGFSVRGVGTTTFSNALQQSVSIVIDDVAQGGALLPRLSFLDVERIEVLRGPQGMLFGRNASAGLVNVVTKAPVLGSFEGRGLVSYGSADEFDEIITEGVVNIPVGEAVALRVHGFYREREGIYRNRFDGADVNGYDDRGAKVRLLWQTDSLKMNLIANYVKTHDPLRVNVYVSTAPGGVAEGILADQGILAGPDNTDVTLDGPLFGDISSYNATLRLDWAIGEHTLTSVSAYSAGKFDANADVDNTPFNYLNVVRSSGETSQIVQELRLASPAEARFEYVAGLYGERIVSEPNLLFDGKLTPFLFPLPLSFALDWHPHARLKSYAAFAQGTFHFTDRLQGILGARFTEDRNHFNYVALPLPGPGKIPFPGFTLTDAAGISEEQRESNVSWRVGLQRDFAADVMGYFTVARGYKGPGFDVAAVVPGRSSQVGPEKPMSYELGLKSTLSERRLSLNLAAFFSDFDGFQAQTADLSGPVAQFRTLNAGRLTTKGVELEFTARPTSGLSLSGGTTYIDAKYDEFRNIPCYPGQTEAQGCVDALTDASGNRLIIAPQWVATVGGNQTIAVSDALQADFGLDYYWRSEATFSAAGDPRSEIGSYGLLGASIALGASGGQWKATLSGRNLLDKRVQAFRGCGGDLVGDTFNCTAQFTRDSFRTLWLTLEGNF